MYEFRPVTDRIERLRARVRDRMIIGDALKQRLILEAKQKYYDYPPILERAYETLYVIGNMNIAIDDDEFLAGDMGNKNWGESAALNWVMMADIENTWPIGEDGLHHAPLDDPIYSLQLLAIAPEDVKELREILKARPARGSSAYGAPRSGSPCRRARPERSTAGRCCCLRDT